MITWVRQKVAQCDAVSHVFVATDDDRIAQAVQSDGGQVVMTRPDHPSGTDRVWEAYQTLLTNGTLAPATHQHPRWILNVPRRRTSHRPAPPRPAYRHGPARSRRPTHHRRNPLCLSSPVAKPQLR
jgi:hypothetical protein